ncbi:MAG: flavodoxin [Patescibacteria group bacterium]|nr:flavodoxin [Patescibacteria group bacterium]
MKILVAYYSRTGVTKKLAEYLAKKINAETEEIKDTVNRAGVVGYMLAGRDGMKRRLTKLETPKLNPADFELVIIGGPIWSWNMSAPIRTYLENYKNQFKKAAFFCTMGGSGDDIAFKEMEEIIGKKPVAALAIKTKEVAAGDLNKAEKFCSEVTGTAA